MSSKAAGPCAGQFPQLPPLKIHAAGPSPSTSSPRNTDFPALLALKSPAAVSAASALISAASTPTSNSAPPTPISTTPGPASTSTSTRANSNNSNSNSTESTSHPSLPSRPQHQHQLQPQPHQPQPHSHSHPHHHPARPAIQPAPARKSLPNASVALAAVAVGPAPAPAPALAPPVDKMSMASVISPMPGPPVAKAPMSMTTKEWVIPPRPKPGRKPATDTPPTKRKAQNRAAQRAFRERRAARVGELEEELEAEKTEHEKALQALQDKIHQLEMDKQSLQSLCDVMENMLDKERSERSKEVDVLRRRLNDATQQQHTRQQSLPSLASVPHAQHTFAPQPLRHHRPSAPSARGHDGRASTSSLASAVSPNNNNTPHRPATTHSFSISQIISPPEDIEQAPTGCGNCELTGPCACADQAMASVNVGCGNCTLGSRCQCLEEVLNGGPLVSDSRSNSLADPPQQSTSRTAKRTIRSISPSSTAPEEKRPRGSLTLATETDFTAMFSRKPKPQPQSQNATIAKLPTPVAIHNASTPQSNAPSPYSLATLAPIESQAVDSPHPEDRCGFCEDGTYCVCAEAAANARDAQPPQAESLTLPSINSAGFPVSQQTHTPPPSEGDAIGYEILPDGSVKLPSLKGLHSRNKPAAVTTALSKPAGDCGSGGPGTCAQCLSDPKSGLFCRSLAANFKKNGESSGGCCGGGGPGGCCKDKNNAASNNKSDLGVSLSCADAYKTLASHKNFSEAADNINTWLPLLRAAPKPREPTLGKDGSNRTPIEVEAASIMSVLKGFDVRFGRGE